MIISNPLIRPAERLLRRLRLGGKLTVLALAGFVLWSRPWKRPAPAAAAGASPAPGEG